MPPSPNIKLIKDPIYGFIEIDVSKEKIILDIIDTVEFQRLRFITQLGLSFYTYPSANHTRFEHSLGVYRLASEFLSKIPENEIDVEDRTIFKIASLIHDLGHGPFSHVWENITKTITKKRLGKKNYPSHEDWLINILNDNTQISTLLEKEGILKDVKSLICFIYSIKSKCKRVRSKPSWLILLKLLSSELDIDRLDYILRDSYFTGVASGVYDFDRLRYSLIYDKEYKRLAVRERDYLTIEGFFISRYHMYRMVYNHKTTISAETVVKNAFLRAYDLYKSNKLEESKIIPPIRETLHNDCHPAVSHYIHLTDPVLMAQIYVWAKAKDPILKDLSTRLINRELFKPILLKRNLTQDDEAKIKQIIDKHGYEPDYYYDYVPNIVPRYTPFSYEVSPEEYKEDVGGVIIYESKKDISEYSSFIKSLISITPQIKGFLLVPNETVRREIQDKVINK